MVHLPEEWTCWILLHHVATIYRTELQTKNSKWRKIFRIDHNGDMLHDFEWPVYYPRMCQRNCRINHRHGTCIQWIPSLELSYSLHRWEDPFPFPLVGYVSFLEGQCRCGIWIHILATSWWMITSYPFDFVIAMKLKTAKGPMCFAGW